MINLKQILQELTGRVPTRDQFVLDASRDIVTAFKSGTSKYEDFFILSRAGEDVEVNLDVKFIRRPKQEYAFSIAASFGPTKSGTSDALEMEIEYNPKRFPNAMMALVSEIKDALEHEAEHVGQQNYEDMYIMSNRYDEPLTYPEKSPQAPTHYLYLTSNREVPAYVKGLVKHARVDKISFEQALENYYSDYVDTFNLHNTDWNKVKQVWMDWWKANQASLKKTK